VPAFKGGLTASALREGEVSYVRLDPHPRLKVWVASPDHTLYTKRARAVLPARVEFGDAVENLGNTALLLAALKQGAFEVLPTAMLDELHQPYRLRLIPGARQILSSFSDIKNCGASVSGSGPSMLVLAGPGIKEPRVRRIFSQAYRKANKKFQLFSLKVSSRGAHIVR